MLDLLHLPTPYGDANVQIFAIPSTVDAIQQHVWSKPRGKAMCHMHVIAGGGAGGGGFTRAAAAAGGGGGGGGAGTQTKLLIPTMFLPDRLFIQVGAGSVGVGSGGGTAPNGIYSSVHVSPNVTTGTNTFCVANPGGGGGTGTGAAVGAAAGGGSAAAITGMCLGGMGLWSSIAGPAGAAGGAVAGAIGGPVAFGTTGTMCLGAPGGGGTTSADFAGGIITATAGLFISEWRPQGAAAGSNNGSGGYVIEDPTGLCYSYCGLGGSSSNAGPGGVGGNGGLGAGGGGGGAGTTGGKGGDGGNGLVVITCW